MRKFIWTVLLALVIPLALAGCGGDSGGAEDSNDNGASDNSKFVGTWALAQDGATVWYILFDEDGSWIISDTEDGSAQRVHGTYTVEGNTASGPMVNPGVGTGEIVAELDGDDTLFLDFVEFWHSPPKHIPYTGSKL